MLDSIIQLRKATIEDVSDIYRVMTTCYNVLTDKSLYVCDSIDYVRQQVDTTVVSCSSSNQVIGYFILRYPHLGSDNLGRDIGIPYEQLNQVVHMESTAVLPKYRGNSLQLKMLQYAEGLIDTTVYHYLIATVSPDNPASYLTFERNSYKLITTKEKYGGLIRRIYLKVSP